MKHILYASLGLLLTMSPVHGENTNNSYNSTKTEETVEHKSGLQILNIPNLNEVLQDIQLYGTLQYGSDDNEIGLLYLKVADQFFEAFLPLINNENIEVGSSDLGAHISVMRYSMGDTIEDMENLPEIGNTYNFKVKYFATVKPDHDMKWDRVWLLTVESSELEDLRESYGLTRKLHDNQHDFHITIAVKLVK